MRACLGSAASGYRDWTNHNDGRKLQGVVLRQSPAVAQVLSKEKQAARDQPLGNTVVISRPLPMTKFIPPPCNASDPNETASISASHFSAVDVASCATRRYRLMNINWHCLMFAL
jgi:hypothetical protein